MERANIEYLLNIFKELTTELPNELIYRENDGCIELKSLESLRDTSSQDMNWKLISSQTFEAA